MSTGVLVAVGAVRFESDVLTAAAQSGLHVVRRCVDVADLMATAATRQAGVALVSTSLGGIDTEVVARLRDEHIEVVGVASSEPSPDATVLHGLGVDVVVGVAELAGLAKAVTEALESGRPVVKADPGAERHGSPGEDGATRGIESTRTGRVVAVWGPTGAPGRSIVSLGLAAGLGQTGLSTMVVDADVYGGSQAQLLGLLDESSGLLAAARSANKGSLDAEGLASHARAVSASTRILTGLPRSDRWVELSPVLLRRVVEAARSLSQVTVVDCAFCLELDEEISYDIAAPRRNGATLTALGLADLVVVVGAADPVGLGRLLRALADLAVHVPSSRTRVVVNRMRPSLGWSSDDVAAIVRRTSQLEVAAFLPDDPAACDKAVVHGRTLTECAAGSKLAKALGRLAGSLAEELGHPRGEPEVPLRRRRAARAR
ncbi:MAG: hypothetical protein QOI06_2017 [Nocardioidaceae bacterium]|nr:hypothetical protein [Nocardioidaceae bacterium]